jgi:ATP-binding cassette subfamily C protein
MDTTRVFELQDPGRWWLVTAGFVDVFCTRIQSGNPVSTRFHICRFDTAAILFGLPEADDVRFIAVVSADAVVRQLDGPPRDGGHPADMDLAAKIDLWLSGLLSACRHEPPVAPRVALSGRGSRAMTADSMIHSAQGLTWIAAPDGRMTVPGQDRCATITDGSFFPATRASSVLIEDAAEVQYADTATWLTRPTCWQELEQANRIISMVLRLEMDHIHSQESRQRSRRAAFEQRMVRDALSGIAGVLDENTGSIPAAPEAMDDILLAACRSVGRVAGIQFTRPVREDATVDTLTAIARAAKVRVRRVRLRPQWWRTDSGPLLGYQGDDAQPVALLPVSLGRYVIHDTVSGSQTDVSADSASRLSAEAVVFYRSFPYKVLALGDLLGFGLRNSGKDVLSVPLLGLTAAFLGLLIPIAAGVIFNTIIPAADRPQLGQIILA